MKEDNNIDVNFGSGDAAAAADAGGVWFEGNDDLKDGAKGESSVDNGDATDARALSLKGEDFYDQAKGDTESERAMTGTYPADCYTFMALHGPFEKNLFFYFGFLVWLFQVTFLVILCLRVANPRLSTNENDDNPDQDQDGAFFSNFVPSNNNVLSKATQFMALASYCLFADASVKDIVTSVETFPRFARARPGDRPYLIAFSCLLRLSQGMLATIVVFLLVINTSDVIDMILNFTAVNFISDFDDVAFELCQWGKYGPAFKKEADRIETLPAPPCIYRKYGHVRYRFTVVPIFFFLTTCLVLITSKQYDLDAWLTTDLRIQFKDDPLRQDYNGCYRYLKRQNRRVLFESHEANFAQAKFGYCQEKKKWYLFTGNKTQACDITQEEQVAYSSKTYTFDISTVFEETWYSPTGTPLELYFFDDQQNNFTDGECQSFLGDGKCDDVFNIFDHEYDAGDCCSATCNSFNCGIKNTITEAFKRNVTSGNGYPHCIDPQMKPITIKVNNVYLPNSTDYLPDLNHDPFRDMPPKDPLLLLDCDGTNVLTVNINAVMKFGMETVWVTDGAECKITVKNNSGWPREMQFINYTVYHGDEKSIESDPIVMFEADSSETGIYSFQRIPECFFRKLNSHIDNTTIYTRNAPSNRAIKWLMEDSSGYSNCEYDTFLERYALATINYAAPITKDENEIDGSSSELWINTERQCEWASIECVDGRIQELDLQSLFLSGTIATEIGLLENLTWLNLGMNGFYGSIPSQIGEWQNLVYFGLNNNAITGAIPTEIGGMQNLLHFVAFINSMNDTIPTEIGKMSVLNTFAVSANSLVGQLPNEIEGASSLHSLFVNENSITGTIPSELGALLNLKFFDMSSNSFTGTIPRELGLLRALKTLMLDYNALTGSIPIELVDRKGNFEFFTVEGNGFSNLIPVDGEVICSTNEGEYYCNCELDCSLHQPQCDCEEAASCCSEYLEQFTNCIVCSSYELENPNMVLIEYQASCVELAFYIYYDVELYGNEVQCAQGREDFASLGCLCSGGQDLMAENVTESPVT